MHAVAVQVAIADVERAREALESEVVPRVSGAAGFQAGYWTWAAGEGGPNGLSLVIFDSKENAQAAADRVRGMLPEHVTLESIEVREVVASAVTETVASA